MAASPPLASSASAPVGDAVGETPAGTPPPPTEAQLNSPTPLTLRLLGVMFLATFIPWAAAKAACNLREGPVRSPSELPTDIFAKQPKSAALELQHRAATGRYREAAELAKGAEKDALLAADARCQAEPALCQALRDKQARVFTRAVLVSRSPKAAEVRTESTGAGDTPERFTLRLEAEEGRWFVTSREPFTGSLSDPPPPAAEPAASATGEALHAHP